MNWFERHLNWITLLVWLFVLPLMIGLGLLIGNTLATFIPYFLLVYLVAPGIAIWVAIWVINKKARSLWWLLAVFVFGFIPLLLLQNQSNRRLQ